MIGQKSLCKLAKSAVSTAKLGKRGIKNKGRKERNGCDEYHNTLNISSAAGICDQTFLFYHGLSMTTDELDKGVSLDSDSGWEIRVILPATNGVNVN